MSGGASKVVDLVCAGCGCGCDDVTLEVRGAQAEPCGLDCELGEHWFRVVVEAEPVARIDGVEASFDEAIAKATELLQSARSPLIYGLSYATCEAQRAAIELAELTGATLDLAGAGRDLEGTAIQNIGAVTATFGELRERADFVLLWNADPSATHPRFFERYLPERAYVLIADSPDHPACAAAERSMILKKGSDVSAVSVLRGLLQGKPLVDRDVLDATGVALDEWKWLIDRMKDAHYGALILPPRGTAATGRQFELALAQLVRELNEHTRFVANRLTAGNAAGAIQTLVAHTGFPCCVDFSSGFPRFDPAQYDAVRRLESGEADLAVFIGDQPPAGAQVEKALSRIPSIYLDSRPTAFHSQASVAFLTARPGVQCAGTFFRADGVALPLRQTVSTKRLSDEAILARLTCELRAVQCGR